jgi:DNA invertase Pin-like site-specific DNA recombinase
MKQKGLRVEFALPGLRKRREETSAPKDPVPRIARLLALAHKWEGLVRRGEVKDYAEIARRMGLSRARVTRYATWSSLHPSINSKF